MKTASHFHASAARARIFAHLVCRGMDRAHKAAEILSAEFPKARLSVILVNEPDEGEGDHPLDHCDPTSVPDVAIIDLDDEDAARAPFLPITATTARMVASLREYLRSLHSPGRNGDANA